jgi:hypothetical protein
MKNYNIIVVGDLHGNVQIAKKIFDEFESNTNKFVFVGDYFDSFTFSVEDQKNLISFLIEKQQKLGLDKVLLIAGNHELSYLYPNKMRCSGYNFELDNWLKESEYDSYLQENLRIFAFLENWLITHAGVSRRWLFPDIEYNGQAIADFLSTANKNDLFAIGSARGGYLPCGGPFWCDFWQEFTPIPGVKQVFGHSAWRPKNFEPIILEMYENNFLIDCLQFTPEVFHIDFNGNAEILKLENFNLL